MIQKILSAAVLALAFVSSGPSVAQNARVKAGLLTCDVSAGIGLVIGSQKSVSCVFSPDVPGPQETYVGSITKFGLDVGITAAGVMVWGVYTNTAVRGPGFLAGDYVGATAEATLAAGLGANALIGGSNLTVALQPISVTGQVGVNLAIGVADLSLRPPGQ
jgi:hypothetical protein